MYLPLDHPSPRTRLQVPGPPSPLQLQLHQGPLWQLHQHPGPLDYLPYLHNYLVPLSSHHLLCCQNTNTITTCHHPRYNQCPQTTLTRTLTPTYLEYLSHYHRHLTSITLSFFHRDHQPQYHPYHHPLAAKLLTLTPTYLGQ